MAIKDLEINLGLEFNDRGLLRQALVHRSYLNEHGGSPLESYERLEFLGDAVLELIVSTELYHSQPRIAEGEMTKRRAALVCRPSLAQAARRLALGDFLALGKGEMESGGRNRESILEETFESIVAAIYLDQGYPAARRFVLNALEPELTEMQNRGTARENPKSRLQELIQGLGKPTPRYRLVSTDGPEHQPVFTAEVLVEDQVVGQGTGSRKSGAEQAAAQFALDNYFISKDAAETRYAHGRPAHQPVAEAPISGRESTQTTARDRQEKQCSHSSKGTRRAIKKRLTRVSSGVGNAGSDVSSMFSGLLIWMKLSGKTSKKS